ncbi:DUF934 domain-containing protein [Paracoccus sp. S-4012]|uniref:DUF934 domain-containing protein n=1 Tax=Paracoccus sp. S-4012 TaxID=2665648 RepID=UPI0012B12B42|nr:DUF934 domain-containing protein [Paracoccus sp. S-4012]MRX51142.1 DUF934 domain-containing protein [Paracoccus sp. S-4012]
MSVIVTDQGFAPGDEAEAPELGPTTDLDALPAETLAAPMLRVAFASFADGRGFTVARRLRAAGYTGRLRACGPLIADQYAMARRAGFDEVEIPDEIAARQPVGQWRFRADGWQALDYRARLRA